MRLGALVLIPVVSILAFGHDPPAYPRAVQWLAAVQSPPHLEGNVPAMTFSKPQNFSVPAASFITEFPYLANRLFPRSAFVLLIRVLCSADSYSIAGACL